MATTWGTTASNSSSVYVSMKAYTTADIEPKKPDTPEQWLRSRVEKICKLVSFK